MQTASRLTLVLAVLSATFLSGCAAFKESFENVTHELQPHRLWRLNRHPAPRRDPYQFSVPDKIPELEEMRAAKSESSL